MEMLKIQAFRQKNNANSMGNNKKTREIPTTNENLTKALNYAKNHKEGFQTFLEDGRLVLSNNLVESHIKPVALGRKAWLFADTPKGAPTRPEYYLSVTDIQKQEIDQALRNDITATRKKAVFAMEKNEKFFSFVTQ